jgi:HflK protein
MIDFLLRVFWETWGILKEASVFLLFGFLLAGVLAVLVPQKLLSKLFNTGKIKSVLWASAIGAPLPLCSCGVVPTALGLSRQGATPGATVAFLVATPETGVDSISLSYALMDPLITVFRPVAAVITAVAAGLATNFLGVARARKNSAHAEQPSEAALDEHVEHSHDHAHEEAHHHGHSHDPLATTQTTIAANPFKRVYNSALMLLDDTSWWLTLGIVLSGIVAAALPPAFFEQYLGSELGSMLLMLAIGIPIYTCASASTPMAAALVMKGLNPGAALVFLLAGPATNLGSLIVLTKFLGARIIAIYLGAIIIVTLAAGYALNWVYRAWRIDPRASFGQATSIVPESVKVAGALLLIALLLYSMRRAAIPGEWYWLRDRVARFTGVWLSARRFGYGAIGALAALYLASGLFAVRPGEVGVKMRFGKIVDERLATGLHYRLPWPIGAHRVIAAQPVRRVEFGFRSETAAPRSLGGRDQLTVAGWNNPTPQKVEARGTWFQRESTPEEPFLLTGDAMLIDLRSVMQYRVKDAPAFAFNVAEPDQLVYSTTRAELRRVVATTGIDAIYTDARSDLEQRVARSVQEALDRSRAGVEIIAFRLLYVHAPDEVHDAFRDVASAQEDKLRTINRAGIFAVEKVNQAKGEAAAMIEQAQGFKQQQIRRAQGDAASFTVRLSEYRRAPELTKFRLQLETIEESLPGVQKFVRPGAGEMKDLDLWLLQPAAVGKK